MLNKKIENIVSIKDIDNLIIECIENKLNEEELIIIAKRLPITISSLFILRIEKQYNIIIRI